MSGYLFKSSAYILIIYLLVIHNTEKGVLIFLAITMNFFTSQFSLLRVILGSFLKYINI